MRKRFLISVFTGLILGGTFLPIARAADVALSELFYILQNIKREGVNSLEQAQLALEVKAIPSEGTTVSATSLVDPGFTVQLFRENVIGFPDYFGAYPALSLLPNNIAKGGFVIRATNGADTTTLTAQAIPDAEVIPLVVNPVVTGDLLAPTVSWDLPNTTVAFNSIFLRIIRPDGSRYQSPFLPVDAKTFTLPADVTLEPDQQYEFRVVMQDFDGSRAISRSEYRFPYSTTTTSETTLNLEEPVAGETYSGVSNIRGWTISPVGVSHVEVFINGEFFTQIPSGGRRRDVDLVFPGTPGALNSGFSMAFPYSNLPAGSNTVTVRAIDKNGVVKEVTSTFNTTGN